jgi:hypothetical protein
LRSGADNSGRLTLETANAGTLTEKMTILPDGKVGIGTSTPTLTGYGTELTLSNTGSEPEAQLNLQGNKSNDTFVANINLYNLTNRLARISAVRNGANNSGRLAFRTNNAGTETEKMTILANGNVGIGTATPSGILHILGSNARINANGANGSGVNTSLRLAGGDLRTVGDATQLVLSQNLASSWYNGAIRLTTTETTPSFLNPRMDFLLQNTATFQEADMVSRMTIISNGNVGIGTATPTHRLQVSGSNGILTTISGASSSVQIGADGNGGVIRPQTVDRLNFTQANGTNVMTINADKVGIGTTTPSTKLEVVGGSTIGSNIDTLVIRNTGSSTGSANSIVMANTGSATFEPSINAITKLTSTRQSDNSNDFQISLSPGGDGTHTQRFYIDGSAGNVGIGTTTPSVRLEVNGLFNADGTPSNEQTGDYTLVLADKGKVLRVNSSSNRTITIPLNSSVAFPIDTEIALIRYGSGTVSISPTSGVTLNSISSNRKVKDRYGSCALKKIGTDEWVLVGSLEA